MGQPNLTSTAIFIQASAPRRSHLLDTPRAQVQWCARRVIGWRRRGEETAGGAEELMSSNLLVMASTLVGELEEQKNIWKAAEAS